jgi:hypothetical protein
VDGLSTIIASRSESENQELSSRHMKAVMEFEKKNKYLMTKYNNGKKNNKSYEDRNQNHK